LDVYVVVLFVGEAVLFSDDIIQSQEFLSYVGVYRIILQDVVEDLSLFCYRDVRVHV
jgi:hypothetical protein